MSSILLRMRRSGSSWERGDVEEFCRAEFWRQGAPDLEVSLFDVATPDVIQIAAEFYGSRPDRFEKPRTREHINVAGLVAPDRVLVRPINSPFAFSNQAHREIHFRDEGELLEFASAMTEGLPTRTHKVETGEIKKYVRDRLANHDPEWSSVADELPRWREWANSGSTRRPTK